jgi:hypothetical protein
LGEIVDLDNLDNQDSRTPAILRWMFGFLHPVEPFGDYFDLLERSVASSAPVCTACI